MVKFTPNVQRINTHKILYQENLLAPLGKQTLCEYIITSECTARTTEVRRSLPNKRSSIDAFCSFPGLSGDR